MLVLALAIFDIRHTVDWEGNPQQVNSTTVQMRNEHSHQAPPLWHQVKLYKKKTSKKLIISFTKGWIIVWLSLWVALNSRGEAFIMIIVRVDVCGVVLVRCRSNLPFAITTDWGMKPFVSHFLFCLHPVHSSTSPFQPWWRRASQKHTRIPCD